ncbi:hypothetical protein HYX11_04110 [Candidatus Woesearchaeota archaeon]|nr:hypothetical protein [Candidatus Woesearchaeota archaeon]
MRKEIEKIKLALDEQVAAINDNSSEIQALFDYLREIEVKLEKVAQRLDTIQLAHDEKIGEKRLITPLNKTEMKLFLVLYTEEMPMTFVEIAKKAELALTLVPEYISSLVSKGIPLHRTFVNNQLFLKLNPAFKEVQAKENVVNLALTSFWE